MKRPGVPWPATARKFKAIILWATFYRGDYQGYFIGRNQPGEADVSRPPLLCMVFPYAFGLWEPPTLRPNGEFALALTVLAEFAVLLIECSHQPPPHLFVNKNYIRMILLLPASLSSLYRHPRACQNHAGILIAIAYLLLRIVNIVIDLTMKTIPACLARNQAIFLGNG